MPEPLRRTPDFPNFDVYPGEARADITVGNPARQLPEGTLVATAGRVGRSMGVAVSAVRDLPSRVGGMKGRLTLVKDRGARAAAQRANEWAERASAKASELGARANELKDNAVRAAQERVQMARRQAQHVAREYPLHVIAGVAGAAFLLGLSLRIWRKTRG